MITHFKIHLAVKKANMAYGPVKAVQPGIIVQPDPAAVRECLPHYYRQAFDRDPYFWVDKHDASGKGYYTIRDKGGRYLNTIYAEPITL